LELVPTMAEITSPLVKKLKLQLIELEAQYAGLEVQNYLENDPRMHTLRNQIEQAKRRLRQEMVKIVEGEGILDPLSQVRKFVVITSTMPGEGKTLTLINLGIGTAELGMKTVLIDARYETPALHKVFGRPKEPGLTNVLMRHMDLQSVIYLTEVENLYFVTSGTIPPDPVKCWGRPRCVS